MIYLFDRAKKLQKIIPRKHIINATQTKVRNGIYQLAVEVPIFYETKQGTHYNYQKSVSKAEFAGHYDDKNRFQLYKIYSRNITANEQGEFLLFDGVHIFFDEAKAMGNIHDRRFRDSEAKAPADVAFNSIGWTVIDYDVTDRHDINFYRASVTDAWNDLISTYDVEFDYELQFDGRKIISKNIIMKKQIGQWTGQRFAYGTNVLTLTQEQDESEVYTAAVGRGRGEESGDGFGPRLEFGDIAWSKDGISKPIGQNYIELPSATAEYGFIENGIVKPRIAPEVIFEDIEDKKLLADATYYWLLENCLPKAIWKTEVARIGNLNLGDTVGVLYKAAGIIKRARVEKIEYNLLDPELSKLTLGDFHHFENRQMKRINAEIKRLGRDNRSLISQAKDEFNQWFNDWVTAFENQFAQAKIDIFAEIEADRENMQNLLDTKSEQWTEVFNQSVAESKEYAEQQAQEKASAVKTELGSVTDGHQTMLQQLESNVMNIDDYLGDARKIPLDQRFLDMTAKFEDRLSNSTRSASNLIRGSRFDEPDLYTSYFIGTSVVTTENINYVRFNTIQGGLPVIIMEGELHLKSGVEYRLHLEYRTDNVTELDGFIFYHNDGRTERLENKGLFINNLETTGHWEHASLTLKPTQDMSGRLALGTRRNFGISPDGIIDVRLPYLTATAHDQWLPNPLDANQNVEEISRRITQLEDGYSEFIVRSVWDAEMHSLNQTIRDYQTTVDGVEDTIIQLKDSEVITRGREVIDAVDGFSRKVWLGDIDRPNMIPYAVFSSRESRDEWGAWGRYGSTYGGRFQDYAIVGDSDSSGNIGIISPNIGGYILPGRTYTITWEASAHYPQTTSIRFEYMYLLNIGDSNYSHRLPNPEYEQIGTGTNVVYRKYKLSFTAPEGINSNTKILFGTHTMANNINAFFRLRHPKLEEGSVESPFNTSYSMIEQRADEISLAVQGIDLNGMLTQSDIRIDPGYVQLGSQRLGDNQLASIFRVSPNSIDAITERMVLNGDLYVDGDITALAVKAIEGNFARLFANQLTANVITSNHIQVGTALVNKIFATSARIDELITKSHFVINVKAMSIEAVEGQFSSLMTKYLNANYIDVNYINGKNAWFETQYVKTSNISNLTSQTAFIRDIQTIEVTANQLNINTLHSKLGSVEGGLTIYGPDGRVLINNSMLRASFDVQVYDSYASANVEFTGLNFYTSSSFWQTFRYFYTDFKGSQLLVSWAVGLQSGNSASEYAEVQVRGFGGNNPIGSRSSRQFVKPGETTYHNQIINLGVPDYSTIQGYLEFRRSPTGVSMNNTVYARVLRVSLIN